MAKYTKAAFKKELEALMQRGISQGLTPKQIKEVLSEKTHITLTFSTPRMAFNPSRESARTVDVSVPDEDEGEGQ